MTFRGYNARLIGVMQNNMDQQKAAAMAITMGIAGAFSKEDGLQTIMGTLDKSSDNLRNAMAGMFEGGLKINRGGTKEDDVVLPAPIQRPPDQRGSKERSPETIQQDIRRLDVIMSKLTGAPVRNPMAGYEGPGAGVSQYDIGRVSTTELLNKV